MEENLEYGPYTFQCIEGDNVHVELRQEDMYIGSVNHKEDKSES